MFKELRPRQSTTIALLIVVVAIGTAGFAFRRPLLINYHQYAMTNMWQRSKKLPTWYPAAAWIRENLALPPIDQGELMRKRANSGGGVKHRDALVSLGYLKVFTSSITPVLINTPASTDLTIKTARYNSDAPRIQFLPDDPKRPKTIIGFAVYSTPNESPHWQEVVAHIVDEHNQTTNGQSSPVRLQIPGAAIP